MKGLAAVAEQEVGIVVAALAHLAVGAFEQRHPASSSTTSSDRPTQKRWCAWPQPTHVSVLCAGAAGAAFDA